MGWHKLLASSGKGGLKVRELQIVVSIVTDVFHKEERWLVNNIVLCILVGYFWGKGGVILANGVVKIMVKNGGCRSFCSSRSRGKRLMAWSLTSQRVQGGEIQALVVV
jgi:hypothetical protein